MVSPERHSLSLPRVEETDLLGIVLEEVIDPTHKAWWEQFATENPYLARQVLLRAHNATLEELSSLEVEKRIVDSILFAMRALRAAAERQSIEREKQYATSGGDDDEGRQPST